MKDINIEKLQSMLATTRGEALAASLLASAAMRMLLSVTENPREVVEAMSAYVDQSLNISGPASGDTEHELNTRMREVARFQAMQHLDAMAVLTRKAN